MREAIRDKGRLEHMAAAIDRILEFMKDKSFDDLPKDKIESYGIKQMV